jgi:hypothetical protein
VNSIKSIYSTGNLTTGKKLNLRVNLVFENQNYSVEVVRTANKHDLKNIHREYILNNTCVNTRIPVPNARAEEDKLVDVDRNAAKNPVRIYRAYCKTRDMQCYGFTAKPLDRYLELEIKGYNMYHMNLKVSWKAVYQVLEGKNFDIELVEELGSVNRSVAEVRVIHYITNNPCINQRFEGGRMLDDDILPRPARNLSMVIQPTTNSQSLVSQITSSGGLIYKLRCHVTGLVYYGCETRDFVKTITGIKSCYKRYLAGEEEFQSVFRILQNQDYEVRTLEFLSCTDKKM